MSIARNQKRLDRRTARLPAPPKKDDDGSVLEAQLLHLVRSSPCPDSMKVAVQISVLAISTVLTTFPGKEAEQAAIVAGQITATVEAMAQRRADGAL